MKKKYEKPEMRAIEINAEQCILQTSGTPSVIDEEWDGAWD